MNSQKKYNKFVYKSKENFIKHCLSKLNKDNYENLKELQRCTLKGAYNIKYKENPLTQTFLNACFASGAKYIVVVYEDEIVKIKL